MVVFNSVASYKTMAGTGHSGTQRQHSHSLEEAIGKIVAGTLECGKLLKKLLLALTLIIWTFVNLPLILCSILLGLVTLFGLCMYYMWWLTLAFVLIFLTATGCYFWTKTDGNSIMKTYWQSVKNAISLGLKNFLIDRVI